MSDIIYAFTCPNCGNHNLSDAYCEDCDEGGEFNEFCSIKRIAILEALVEDYIALLDQIVGWRIGIMGEFGEVYSGSVSRQRIDNMYLEAVASLDGDVIGAE